MRDHTSKRTRWLRACLRAPHFVAIGEDASDLTNCHSASAWPRQKPNTDPRLGNGSMRLREVNPKGFRRSGSVMSHHSPRNVVVVKHETGAVRWHRESLPIGREYRPVARRQGLSERVLTRRRGIVREPEKNETPLPGKSSERPWSKRREPDIRNVEVAVRVRSLHNTKGQGRGRSGIP